MDEELEQLASALDKTSTAKLQARSEVIKIAVIPIVTLVIGYYFAKSKGAT